MRFIITNYFIGTKKLHNSDSDVAIGLTYNIRLPFSVTFLRFESKKQSETFKIIQNSTGKVVLSDTDFKNYFELFLL